MDNSKTKRLVARKKRVFRVRKKVQGTAERPRLSVSKTNKHVSAQLINDVLGVTIAGVGTLSKGVELKKSKTSAREIGKLIAEMAKKQNIDTVVFDRGRYKYHGVVAELATGAREAGLQF